MKKIFTLLVSLGTLSSVFAQSNNHYSQQSNDRNVSYQSRSYDQPGYSKSSNATAYDHNGAQQNNGIYYDKQQPNFGRSTNATDYGRNSNQQNNRGYNDRQRQQEMDRINHDYDKRIGDYRNDRSLNVYERNRRIQQAEQERSSKIKSFGGGVLLGGIIGVLIGSHL